MWWVRIWIFYTQSELIFVECVYTLRTYRIKPSLYQFSLISLQRVVPFFVLEMLMFSFLMLLCPFRNTRRETQIFFYGPITDSSLILWNLGLWVLRGSWTSKPGQLRWNSGSTIFQLWALGIWPPYWAFFSTIINMPQFQPLCQPQSHHGGQNTHPLPTWELCLQLYNEGDI